MEDGLNKIVKAIKTIKPEEGFLSQSKNMIFAAEQKPMRVGVSLFESMKLAAALALASALLFVAFGGLSYFHIGNFGPSLLTKINNDNLNAEGQNLDFQIQLGQAKYTTGNQTEVGVNIVNQILKNLSL